MAEATPAVGGGSRSLLGFGPATVGAIPPNPDRKPPRRPRTPEGHRQGQRLAPQFQSLQGALASELTGLGDSTTAPDPELIAVLELVGTVAGFVRATEGVEGLRFLTDFAGDGLDPDDDFYYAGDDNDPTEDGLPQSLYLVMANARAIDELIRLFGLWQRDGRVKFERGLAPLKQVFSQLHTIRRWGPRDRVRETGLLDQWREDVEVVGAQGSVLIEVELVWGYTPELRRSSEATVRQILTDTPGAVLHASCIIESIGYHGVMAELPYSQVESVLQDGPESIALLTTDSVLFVSKAEPMTLVSDDGVESNDLPAVASPPVGPPRAALLDGVPLANHELLVDRLRIDDPDDRSAAYTVNRRCHGTAMASLMIHGDLACPGRPIASPVHVHPILVPHECRDNAEVAPPGELFIDVIHRAFQRMFGGASPSAQSVRIVNLSIGEPARTFARRLSPLARLLDHLAFKFNLLIVVSAGNHSGIVPVVPASAIEGPADVAKAVRAYLHEHARQRRLLSPADSVNSLAVGAVHDDGTDGSLPDGVIDPLTRGSVALYSPVGLGFKRSPKPELHAPGGRSVVLKPVPTGGEEDVELHPAGTTLVTGPGLRAAAPTASGSLSGSLYSCGTSNAAALVSHRAAHLLHSLEDHEPGQDEAPLPDAQYHPVLLKALLVHATAWEQQAWGWAEELGASGNSVRRLLTQQLGFGVLDPNKVGMSSPHRVCLVGAGSIKKDQRYSFEVPLPASLASAKIWKRLTTTLAWLSPIEPSTQQYRVAHLAFTSPRRDLRVEPKQVAHYANGKGTVLHEVLEGDRAAGFVEDAVLAIDVDCRVRVGRLYEPVRFGLAVSIEVAPELEVDLHQEVRERLAVAVRERAQARVGN